MSSTSTGPASVPAPIACTLTERELRSRQEEVNPLFAHILGARELPDGYAFAFPPDASRARNLLDFILAERACCAFFTFDLTFPAPHDAIWLHLRGGEEVKAFVRDGFLTRLPRGIQVESAE